MTCQRRKKQMNDNKKPESIESLMELTDEQLTAELHSLVKGTAVSRTAYIWGYFVTSMLCIPVSIAPYMALIPKISAWSIDKSWIVSVLALLVPFLLSLMVGLAGSVALWKSVFYGISKKTYHDLAQQRQNLFVEIAKRNVANALPNALALLNIGKAGYLSWSLAAPLLINTVKSLLAKITRDEFSDLPEAAKNEIAMLLTLPDSESRESILHSIVEAGDKNILARMRWIENMSILDRPLQGGSFEEIRLALIAKITGSKNKPFARTSETLESLSLAITGLSKRLEEEGKLAQLLRPSNYNPALEGKELLRPAGSSTTDAEPDSLLRPASQERQSPAEFARKYLPEQEQETVKTFRD